MSQQPTYMSRAFCFSRSVASGLSFVNFTASYSEDIVADLFTQLLDFLGFVFGFGIGGEEN
ncbi:hypothetical protein ACOSP7_002567 [Xanthoceras sorbifolium]